MTVAFLRSILPSTGLYVACRLIDGKFRNQICESIEELAAQVLNYDAQGVAAYHACAAYREPFVLGMKDGKEIRQVRTHKNVKSLRSYFMDLDVKPGNPAAFESQEQAIIALADFCQVSRLPIPMVISSGGGIHTYWTLTHDIIPETWKPVAEALKALAAKLGFKADPACTADTARVLRPIGTWNRKTDPARPVELVADSEPVDPTAFATLVHTALKAQGVKAPEGVRQVESKTETLNQAFAVTHDFPPCSGIKIADRCAQLAKMRDTRGCISEPHWYAGIQLLCHAIEGDELIHQWSNGHGSYSIEETQRKIAQIRDQTLGPSLCSTFETRNSGGCDGCPFKGKISSPAQLGTYVASAPAPVVEFTIDEVVTQVTLPLPPPPFTRGEKGGIYIEEEGITHKIYEYDFFPVELAYDEQLGYETTRWRHWLPQEGWKECTLRSSLLARPVDFETELRDQHIQPLIRNKMAMYGDAYIRDLKKSAKMRQLFKAQGWKNEDTEFVLGDKLYRKDEIIQAGFSNGAKGFLSHFKTKGNLEPWRDLTWAFNTPGLEPHAFMLLCAFAAPLLKLDRRKGFTVSAMGPTGAGKSTMGQFLASVYGHPEDTWAKRDDTAAARVERIGAYYSLPLYMDEITTVEPKELRALVYSIATGKGRDSLKQDRTLREGVEWATILLTSTNDSLQAKLMLEKTNAEAESMRLFEFRFPMIQDFGIVASLVPGVVFENYGLAGAKYIQYIVNNLDRVKAGAHEAIIHTEKVFGMDSKERFWSQAVALALYGGHLAREIGLIDFDPDRLRPWMLKETRRMRRDLGETHVGSVSILADYMNRHIGERIVVTKLNAGMTAQSARPTRELSQRYEKDINRIWISRTHLTKDFNEHRFDVNDLRDDLITRGILLDAGAKKVLGAGTDYTGGQTSCWMIASDHPELNGLLDE